MHLTNSRSQQLNKEWRLKDAAWAACTNHVSVMGSTEVASGHGSALTSSRKMMLGARSRATLKRARTSFSASPCHLDVRAEADTARNAADAAEAAARASSVFPFPGGPYSKMPRSGARMPCTGEGSSTGSSSGSSSGCALCRVQVWRAVELGGASSCEARAHWHRPFTMACVVQQCRL